MSKRRNRANETTGSFFESLRHPQTPEIVVNKVGKEHHHRITSAVPGEMPGKRPPHQHLEVWALNIKRIAALLKLPAQPKGGNILCACFFFRAAAGPGKIRLRNDLATREPRRAGQTSIFFSIARFPQPQPRQEHPGLGRIFTRRLCTHQVLPAAYGRQPLAPSVGNEHAQKLGHGPSFIAERRCAAYPPRGLLPIRPEIESPHSSAKSI